jgi:hypothetical protein
MVDVKGEPLGPMSFFFLDLRCFSGTVDLMAWAGLEDKLVEEVVKSCDLGGSFQKERGEHEALRVAVSLVCDNLSLVSKQEGSPSRFVPPRSRTGCVRSQGLRSASASISCSRSPVLIMRT